VDRIAPGRVRDHILDYMFAVGGDAGLTDICDAVALRSPEVPKSSVRSYLSLNTPGTFQRVSRGRYRLNGFGESGQLAYDAGFPTHEMGHARLVEADAFDWMATCQSDSIHAVVTDPPYGLVEYSEQEKKKLRLGRGGVWRIPPSFDGHRRSPLPRFTVLGPKDRDALRDFFYRVGVACHRICVPGANVIVAGNPLLANIVASAMSDAGLELRGTLVRLVMTMRGGDRPKNAHREFADVTVMPRSMWEPWIVLRKPLEGRVQDNLRKWGTGGFLRPSAERPFGDVIRSGPTSARERRMAPHPSLKPQAFLRQIVRAVLPFGRGTILDPFAGSGSTLAAANAVGYRSIGVEADREYADMARKAIPRLADLAVE
jgi:DNA modification methylase